MKVPRNLKYSIQHTLQRLQERYQLEWSEEDYWHLVKLCKERKGEIIANEKEMQQQILDLVYKEKIIRVVWNTAEEIIKTVIK